MAATLLIEYLLLFASLAIALYCKPWRMLRGAKHLNPLLATLVIYPWVWSFPALHPTTLQVQWSGACLVLLMLGWPLAIPTLCLVGLLATWIASMSWQQTLGLIVWQGIVPATLALGVGAGIRRFIGPHLFVYILGRGFLGSVVCLFASAACAQWLGGGIPGVGSDVSLIAHWLAAWGDAFVTGMLCAIFVAFKPAWLATWSDNLYLRQP